MTGDSEILFRHRVETGDIPVLAALTRDTGKFSDDEVAIAVELLTENLSRGEESGYLVTIALAGMIPVGFTCFGRIPCTRSSFDLYWIVVDPRSQGRGIGAALMAEFENQVRSLGGTNVFIDTSLRSDYAPTRAFYERCGYTLEAQLADFYGPSDGKAIFSKRLAAAQ